MEPTSAPITFDPQTVVGLDDKPIPPVTFDSSSVVGLDDKPIPPVTFDASTVVGLDDKPTQQGPVNPYANQSSEAPSLWQRVKGDYAEGAEAAQGAIDKAATTEPVDTRSVGGFAKSVANNLGAGATRMFFSPIAHPLQTVAGIAKIGRAAVGDTGALYDVTKGAVEPFVRNPSGEAVAALPMAALAATGLGGRAAAAEAPEEAAAATPKNPGINPEAPPSAGPSGGGGGGNAPVQPQSGGGGGGVATAVKTQVVPKLSPADQALAEQMAAEKAQPGRIVPPELQDLQARAARAQEAARKAQFQVDQEIRLQDAAKAQGKNPAPLDPAVFKAAQEAQQNARLLRAMADDVAQTAAKSTAEWNAKLNGGKAAGTSPTPIPSPTEVGAQYIARVKSGMPPAIAAAGLGMTPEHQEAAHVAHAFVPQTMGSVSGSQQPPAPPTPQSPSTLSSPAAVQQQAQQATVAEVAASAQSINKQAAQIAAGVPPPKPPQVPLPQGMDDGHLSQQTVDTTGRVISSLPPAMQPKAVLEATGNLAKWLFEKKTAIGPDGKVVNVDSQKAAQTVAVGIINDEVDRQAEQAKAAQDAQQKAIEERQENAKTAQEERDEAITPEEKKASEKSTGSEQPVEIPDTPATRKAIAVLGAAPMDATAEQLDALIRRTATVTAGVRKRMVEDEVRRRAAPAGRQGASWHDRTADRAGPKPGRVATLGRCRRQRRASLSSCSCGTRVQASRG